MIVQNMLDVIILPQTMTLDTFWNYLPVNFSREISFNAVCIFGLLQLCEPWSSREVFDFCIGSVSNHF
jgi:hypothetical protein